MIYSDKKSKYVLNLTEDGRVVSREGTFKAASVGNKPGGRIKIPPGFVVHKLSSNQTFDASSPPVLVNKDSFESFQAWVNSGERGTEDWTIEQTSGIPEYGKKEPRIPAKLMKADEEHSIAVLSGFLSGVKNHFSAYAASILQKRHPRSANVHLTKEDRRNIAVYMLQTRALYENNLMLLDEKGNPILDENGNPTPHPNRDVILLTFDSAAEDIERDIVRANVSQRIFEGSTEKRTLMLGIRSRSRAKNLVRTENAKLAEKNSETPEDAVKRIKTEDLTRARASLDRLSTVAYTYFPDGTFPDDFQEILRDAEGRMERLNQIESEISDPSMTRAQRKMLLEEAGNLTIESDTILKAFEKLEDGGHVLTLFKALSQNKIALDQDAIDALIENEEGKLKKSKLTREKRREIEDTIAFYKAISLSNFYENAVKILGSLGVSEEKVRNAFLSYRYGGKTQILDFDENGDIFIKSERGIGFSVAGRDGLAAHLNLVFGFSETTDLTRIFSTKKFLADPSVGMEVVGWNFATGKSNLTPQQIYTIEHDQTPQIIAIRDRVQTTLNNLIFHEKFKFAIPGKRGNVSYTIQEALSIDDDEERYQVVSALTAHLFKEGEKSDSKYTYLAESLQAVINVVGKTVEKIPPDGSSISDEKLELNKRGRLACDNIADAVCFMGSGYDFGEAGQLGKMAILKTSPFFKNLENGYSLAVRFSIPLGVHVSDGVLKMPEYIRETIELHFRDSTSKEDVKSFENLSESEQTVFLTDYYSRNYADISSSMATFAAARLTGIFGTSNIRLTNENFQGSKMVGRLKSLPKINSFVTKLKSLIGKSEEGIRELCKVAVKDLNYSGKEAEIAEEFLHRAASSHSRGDGHPGNYTEAYVNLGIAQQVGTVASYTHSTEARTPSILEVTGADGKRYHIATHATKDSGFGDSFLVEFSDDGKSVTLTPLEQKYQLIGAPKINPHLADTTPANDVIEYYRRLTGKEVKLNNVAGVFVNEAGEVSINFNLGAALNAQKSSTAGYEMNGILSKGL